MVNSTPEYVAAHLRELGDHPPKVAPELKAKYRMQRRTRRLAWIARVLRPVRGATERTRTSTTAEAPRSRPNPAS